MRRLSGLRHLVGLLAALVLLAGPAQAAELLMFDARTCPWCLRWKQEVGPAYPLSPEGRRAPLRIVALADGPPPGARLRAPVTMTPTFVLLDGTGSEIDRITGYPGADFFWGLLAAMIKKLPPQPAGG
jgi:hypothetical protein